MGLDDIGGFDWDEGNILKNWEKHKVKHTEAEEVFENKPRFVFPDTQHSKVELRYGILGVTNEKRLLSVTFMLRSNRTRVVSARDMSKRERKFYEKIKAATKI
ncbi:MAG: BrnT family toxin [Candidatus Woykebacteria bacterium]